MKQIRIIILALPLLALPALAAGEEVSGVPGLFQGLRKAAHGRTSRRGGSSSSSKLLIYTSQKPRMAVSSWAKKPS